MKKRTKVRMRKRHKIRNVVVFALMAIVFGCIFVDSEFWIEPEQ